MVGQASVSSISDVTGPALLYACFACMYVNMWVLGSHQSNEGGEDHAHTDHHSLLRADGWPDLKVVVGKDRFRQILLHIRRTCVTDGYWAYMTVSVRPSGFKLIDLFVGIMRNPLLVVCLIHHYQHVHFLQAIMWLVLLSSSSLLSSNFHLYCPFPVTLTA